MNAFATEEEMPSGLQTRVGGISPVEGEFIVAFGSSSREPASGIFDSLAKEAPDHIVQLEPVAELDGAGNVVSRFVYATKGHAPDYMVKDGQTYRVLSDHLGSPRMVVDVDTGAVVQRMDFDAWGVVTLDTNPGWQPFGFAGGLWDADTGLVRFGARDYAAAEGRWTAKDLLRFVDGTNAYGYSIQDPINRIDPNGEMSLVVVGLGGVGVALGVAAGGTGVIYCMLNPDVCANALRDLADGIGEALAPKPVPVGPTIYPGEPEIDPDSTCEADPDAGPKRSPLERCRDAASTDQVVWDQFCRSLPENLRGACWANNFQSAQKKRGWCDATFQ